MASLGHFDPILMDFGPILIHFDQFDPCCPHIPAGTGPFPAVLFHKTAEMSPRIFGPFWAILDVRSRPLTTIAIPGLNAVGWGSRYE